MSRQQGQGLIDSVVADGGKVVPRSRRYNGTKFADLWSNRDRTAIYARLISSARRMFIRYLDIPSDKYQPLINAAAGFAVDLNSEAYEVMYVRLNEWKKNWFSLYAQAATVLQKELEVAKHWGGLDKSELVSAYSGVYTPEYTITLFRRIHAGTIDWRASLRNTKLNALYRTAFTYCMVYVSPELVHLFVRANCLQYRYLHRSVHFPGEMSRKDALDRFKLIGFDRVFEDSVGMHQYVLTPEKPAAKSRVVKKKPRNLRDLSPGFEPLTGDGEENL